MNERKFKLEGTVYEMWTILNYAGRKHNRNVYFCRCECGTERTVGSYGNKLLSKCCGCKKPPNWKKGLKSPVEKINIYSTLISRYKKDARTRKLVFDLTQEEFVKIITQPCFYCNREKTGKQMYNNWGMVEYTGIDRVNNLVGYTVENCVPCCKDCNILKKAVTPDIIEKAYHFLFGKNNNEK